MSTPFDPSKLKLFPQEPGVYLMKDGDEKVLYIGKAKNLRVRVRQYFSGADSRAMIPHLTASVVTIDTIIVGSEKEALLLENTLIKKHQPKYNVLLKDDKSYISIKINHKDVWPMMQLVRTKGKVKKDGWYFGPYTNAHAARRTLDQLNRLFPLRQCTDREFARRERPCMLYQIKKCCGPCVGKVDEKEYRQHVERVAQFLRGQDEQLITHLHQEMAKASGQLEFEKAGDLLHLIRSIEKTMEEQKVVKVGGKDFDAYGLYRRGGDGVITQMIYREGKLVGAQNHSFIDNVQGDADLLESLLVQFYTAQSTIPHEVYLPVDVEESDLIGELLSEGKRRTMKIFCPLKGEKKKLVDMALSNAEATFKQERDEEALREKMLLEMQELFSLNNYPTRIECFDNSNLSGTEPVAAMVVFSHGQKDGARYRMYKVKTVEGPDDYGTMVEILRRRYQRAKDEGDLPDLIIVDGGKGQLSSAMKVLRELDISTVDVIGLAKEKGRHDKGMTSEQVFLPGAKEPIRLDRSSPILFLMQNIRDEAHRFAITFHRKRRSKAAFSCALDTIPGIGPTKKKRLLKHFGSVKRVKAATEEELKAIPGITKKDIEQILLF